MIDAAVAHLAKELGLWLRRTLRIDEELVAVCALRGNDGQTATQATDKLAVFVVNVERETTVERPRASTPGGEARRVETPPPISLNLNVMLAANFGGNTYLESLKLLSQAVAFVQARPVFDHQNSPGLDPVIERLTVELENLNLTELANLWGVLGGHYVPSLLLRVRMLTIAADLPQAQVAVARSLRVGIGA